jgi:hypothetical protein
VSVPISGGLGGVIIGAYRRVDKDGNPVLRYIRNHPRDVKVAKSFFPKEEAAPEQAKDQGGEYSKSMAERLLTMTEPYLEPAGFTVPVKDVDTTADQLLASAEQYRQETASLRTLWIRA